MRVCLSGNPECSGLNPCVVCWDFVKTQIVPRAMVMAGQQYPPFSAPGSAPLFIQAFVESWRQNLSVAARHMPPTLNAAQGDPNAIGPEGPVPPSPQDMQASSSQGQGVVGQGQGQVLGNVMSPAIGHQGSASDRDSSGRARPLEPKPEAPQEGYPVDESKMKEYVRMARHQTEPVEEPAREKTQIQEALEANGQQQEAKPSEANEAKKENRKDEQEGNASGGSGGSVVGARH